jgi:hypothetical protein
MPANMTFNITPGLAYKPGDYVQASNTADNYVIGVVVSYNKITGVLVITPVESKGSGTFSSWQISLTGSPGSSGTAGTAGTAGNRGVSGSSAASGQPSISGSSGQGGASRLSGSSGTSASSGTSGSSGTSAISGASGNTGASRSSGTSGSSGVTGSIGGSGISGFSGGSGSSGLSRPNGVAGGSGVSGNSGTSGSAGVSGANGPQGPVGPQGPRGPQGAAGASGSSGTNGPTGPPGPTGPAGATGPQGFQGAAGPQGAQGPTGPAGPPGPPGPTGSTGPQTVYNQLLNTNSSVSFANAASAGEVYTGSDFSVSGNGIVSGGNQGIGWRATGSWETFGACGSTNFFSTSSKIYKKNIQPYSPSAVKIINDVNIVSFNYIDYEHTKVGFIAEDTPIELATEKQDSLDTMNSLGLILKALQELNSRIDKL